MSLLSTIQANGDFDRLVQEIQNTLSVVTDADNLQEAIEWIEKDTFERNLFLKDDDVVSTVNPVITDKIRKHVSSVMYDGTPKSQEAINDEVVARAEIEYNKQNLQSRGSYDKPVTPEYVHSRLLDEKVSQDINQALNSFSHNIKSESGVVKKVKQEAITKKNTDYSNTYKKVANIEREQVDWEKVLTKEAKNPEDAYNRLQEFITCKIEEKYGGWSRITSIVVRDSCLIINNTMYVPVIEDKYINADIFPLDTLSYIKEGKLAYLFNWKYLKKMTKLYSVDIDDASFYVTSVGAVLGFSRSIGVATIFRSCRSLNIFKLGSETITRDSLNKPESAPIKSKVDTIKRFMNFYDGYSLNIYSGTNGIQNYMLNNLRQYATNRGNKGLFRFCTGTLVRAGLFTSAGVVNLATHTIGGVLSALFSGKY